MRSLTPSEIDEICELRLVLEIFALRAATRVGDPEAIERLVDLAGEIDRPGGGVESVELQGRFYDAVYGLPGLTRSAQLIAGLRAEVGDTDCRSRWRGSTTGHTG